MKQDDLKIGIALSGGGIRATIFHLGVFKYLAEKGLMSRVAHVSSVSGASLCVALIFAKNGNVWPSDQDYLEKVLPKIETAILNNNIQRAALFRLLFLPWYWGNHVSLIARMIREKWQVKGSLQNLADSPVWDINCTTVETGNRFRLRKDSMGDYELGYVKNPDLPIADVAAASAGFPILIGPYALDTRKFQWDKKPRENTYHLWDGGVYDNMGLEALYKSGKGLTSGVNYLIISNASGPIEYMERKSNLSAKNLKRLLDIAMDQVNALRGRDVFSNVLKQNDGLYVNIGNSAQKIVNDGKIDPGVGKELIASCMTAEEALKVRNYSTTLDSPSQENYNLILRHGYENTKCCYTCFYTE
jgi:NTE family protein